MPKPKILTRLTQQIRDRQGYDTGRAERIATAALQKSGNLKPGTQDATAKGIKRGEMGAGGRAIDREVTYSGGKHKASDYVYSSKTNRATLKGKK